MYCLLGICDAAAQAASDAATTAVSAAESTHDASDKLTWAAIVVLIVAQQIAPLVLRFYRRRVEKLMTLSARKAAGQEAGSESPVPWDADTLLAGMERKRLAVLRVLVGVAVLYSVVAAFVYAIHLDDTAVRSRGFDVISLAVSFFMFGSFSAPIILLGVSAARFASHFWRYFAPAAFAAVAMQIIVADAAKDDARLILALLAALGAIGLLTGAAVAVREWSPALRRRAGVWVAQRPHA
jgi:hypothetical protein